MDLFEKGEHNAIICHDLGLAKSTMCKICNNAD
jgi:hypothetical protein